jgi:hypothetical protein
MSKILRRPMFRGGQLIVAERGLHLDLMMDTWMVAE